MKESILVDKLTTFASPKFFSAAFTKNPNTINWNAITDRAIIHAVQYLVRKNQYTVSWPMTFTASFFSC
jgi:hypothetical protein